MICGKKMVQKQAVNLGNLKKDRSAMCVVWDTSVVAPETGGLKAREEAVKFLVFFCLEGASGVEGRQERSSGEGSKSAV